MSVSSDSTITDRTSGNRQPVPVGEGSGPSDIAAPRVRPTDGELLTLFVRHEDRAALDRLVDRHAAMVWRVCRATLRRSQDAEDAFQATFLLLVRSARSIKSSDSAAGWLYRVAYRTSLRARKKLAARREESLAVDPDAPSEAAFPDLLQRQTTGVLVEELMRLPAKYQTPLVMRYLEGQSRRAIADQTDTTIAAVQGQLARGKQMLRHRLLRRGVSLATTMAALGLGARGAQAAETVPAHLIASTTSHSVALASGGSLAASAAIVSLYQEGARAMLIAWLGKPVASLAAAAVIALMLLPNAPAGEGTNNSGGKPPGLQLAIAADASLGQPEGPAKVLLAEAVPAASRRRQSPEAVADNASQLADATESNGGSDRDQAVAAKATKSESTELRRQFVADKERRLSALYRYLNELSRKLDQDGTAESEIAEEVRELTAEVQNQLKGLRLERAQFELDFVRSELAEIRAALDLSASGSTASHQPEPTGSGTVPPSGSRREADTNSVSAEAPPAAAPQPPAAPPATSPPVPPQPSVAVAPQLTPLRAPEGGGAGKYAERNREYGWSVQQLQERLNTRLNPSPDLDADGDYGPKTEGAVKRFQRQNGLPITGFADTATVSAMGLATVVPSNASESKKADELNTDEVVPALPELERRREAIETALSTASQSAKQGHELFRSRRSEVTRSISQVSGTKPSWTELQTYAIAGPLVRALWSDSDSQRTIARQQLKQIEEDIARLVESAEDSMEEADRAKLNRVADLAWWVQSRLTQMKQIEYQAPSDPEAVSAKNWRQLYTGAAAKAISEAIAAAPQRTGFGLDNTANLRQFQKENGLKATGEFNEATWNALFGLGDKPSDAQSETSTAGRQPEPSALAADEPTADPPTTGVAGSPVLENAPPTEPQPAALDQIEQLMATAEAESAKLVSLARQTLKMLAFEKPGKTSLSEDMFRSEGRLINAPLTSALVETGRQQRALAEQAWDAAQQAIKEYGKERLQSAASEADVAQVVTSLQADLNELDQRLKALQRNQESVPVILSGREAVATPTQSEPSKAKPKLSDEEIGARLAEGWRKFFAQDMKGAEEAFRDVLKSQPDNSSGTNGLAFCLLNRGEPAEAEPLFKKLLKEEPNAPGPLNGLARCLQARGDTDGAINAWEKSRSGMPSGQPSAATAALARVYSERADWAKARPLLKEMLASNPGAEPYAGWLKKAQAATADAAEPGSVKPAEPPLFVEPTVVETVPARDATKVDPGLKEIRVTFDRDMGRGMSWTGTKETGMPPLAAGRSARWIDKRTCVLRLGKLEPGRAYRVGINAPSFKNFKSIDGKPAAIDELRFVTEDSAKEASDEHRVQSMNNLKTLMLALLTYNADHNGLPAASHAGLSWRVAILPQLGHEELYRRFHLDEPWDSPHNMKLLGDMPKVFHHPRDGYELSDGQTSYQAVAGDRSYLDPEKLRRYVDIKDGSSKTISLVEVGDRHAVPWTQPEDFSPTEPFDVLHRAGYGHYFIVAFADGSVQSINSNTSKAELLKKLLIDDEYRAAIRPQKAAQEPGDVRGGGGRSRPTRPLENPESDTSSQGNVGSASWRPQPPLDELKFTTSSEVVPTASRRRESSEVSHTETTPPTGVGGSPGVSG